MLLLKCDIRSHFSGRLYSSAGSNVKIISDHGDVAIVEGEDGKRFSCRVENIVTDESLVQLSEPDNKILNLEPVRKSRKSKPGSVQTLF